MSGTQRFVPGCDVAEICPISLLCLSFVVYRVILGEFGPELEYLWT